MSKTVRFNPFTYNIFRNPKSTNFRKSEEAALDSVKDTPCVRHLNRMKAYESRSRDSWDDLPFTCYGEIKHILKKDTHD